VYQNLEGKAEIRNIVALDLGRIAETGEIEDAQPSGGQTLGGWTVERFGDFPHKGDSIRYENVTVTVLAMDGRRVEKLLAKVDPPVVEES
jgi:CBS domain containing-hemolysin-like protein